MNITEAEHLQAKLKPPYTYLVATVYETDEKLGSNMDEYIEISESISYAKDGTDIRGLEDVISALESVKEFYSVDNLVSLYKDDISEEDIQLCKNKTKECDSVIDELKKTIERIKNETEV